MPSHSKADFAKLCGLTTGNLTNYIKRGKVIQKKDGKIDDANPTNREFLKSRSAADKPKEKKKKPASAPSDEKVLRMIKPDPGDQDEDDVVSDDDPGELPEGAGMYALQKKKLQVEITKKTREINLLQLREEKIRGEVVPVELIKNLFSAHTQSILTAQKDGIEDLLTSFSMETRLKGEQLARLRGKMVEILNRSVDKAVTITKKNLKNLISQYSLKKDVGERG